MNRVAVDLGFIKIYWYSITMFLGVLMGIIVAYTEIKRKKISSSDFSNMAFYAILCGFIGARIYYVLFNLDNKTTTQLSDELGYSRQCISRISKLFRDKLLSNPEFFDVDD